jgi:hypothetical protein
MKEILDTRQQIVVFNHNRLYRGPVKRRDKLLSPGSRIAKRFYQLRGAIGGSVLSSLSVVAEGVARWQP